MFRNFIILTIALSLSSCTYISLMREGEDINIGIKIATIADSQITTPENSEGNVFRTVLADKFSNWAIRTTAQESLALENLGYFLEDMEKRNPDVIFYLGDGMNSGCKDETDSFFETLKKSRRDINKPIYFLIGNHDYLATGNQVEPDVRLASCGGYEKTVEKNYYTKKEIIEIIDRFNQESYSNFNSSSLFVGFKDNIGANGPAKPWETSLDTICAGALKDQHKNGCFYTGILQYNKGGIKGQIILTDTSDYKDIDLKPEIDLLGALNTELYGIRGSISWKDGGQSDWIVNNLNASYNDIRIVASHYPIGSLGYTSYKVGSPADILLKEKNKNLWLSAHTHIKNPKKGPRRNRFSENFYFTTTATTSHRNVGSTTDYIPHYAIVESINNEIKMSTFPSFDDSECKLLTDTIELDFDYLSVLNESDKTDVLIGMTGDYRNPNYSTKNARQNLNSFLDALVDSDRKKYVQCLLYISAKNERELNSIQKD